MAGHARAPAVVLALLAGLGATAVLVTSRHGPIATPDSAVYLGAARNLVHGHGLTVPFTTYTDRYTPAQAAARYGRVPLDAFPPLYPLALAVGGGTETMARVLGALLLAVNLALLAGLTYRASGQPWAAVGAAAVCLAGPGGLFGQPWVVLHATMLSEPLFLACTLGALVAVSAWLRGPSRRRVLAVAALCAAATLTRYVGFAVTVAAVGAMLLWGWSSLRERLRDATLVAAAGTLPAVAFLLVQRLRSGVSTHTLGYHPPSHALRSIRLILAAWLGFGSEPREAVASVVLVLIVAGYVGLAIAVGPRRRDADGLEVFRVLLLFGPAYVVAVWSAHTFFDGLAPLDARLLSPLRAVLLVLVFGGLGRIGARLVSPVAVGVAVAAVALAMAGPAVHGLETIVLHRDLASLRTTPALEKLLRGVPKGTLVVTNHPDTVYLATRRPSILAPVTRFAVEAEPNRRYDADVRELARLLVDRHGRAVMDVRVSFGEEVMTADELRAAVPTRVIARSGDYVLLAPRG